MSALVPSQDRQDDQPEPERMDLLTDGEEGCPGDAPEVREEATEVVVPLRMPELENHHDWKDCQKSAGGSEACVNQGR